MAASELDSGLPDEDKKKVDFGPDIEATVPPALAAAEVRGGGRTVWVGSRAWFVAEG
jgi:hypothetical protein